MEKHEAGKAAYVEVAGGENVESGDFAWNGNLPGGGELKEAGEEGKAGGLDAGASSGEKVVGDSGEKTVGDSGKEEACVDAVGKRKAVRRGGKSGVVKVGVVEELEASGGGIYAAMAAVMAGIEAVGKSKRCKEMGYSYRGIDDVYNMLHPLLARNGIFMLPRVLERTAEQFETAKNRVVTRVCLRIEYKFVHRDGSFAQCVVMGEGADTSDKSIGKAMAYAAKYCLLQTFCIPTEDMPDPDAEKEEFTGKLSGRGGYVGGAGGGVSARDDGAERQGAGGAGGAGGVAAYGSASGGGEDGKSWPGRGLEGGNGNDGRGGEIRREPLSQSRRECYRLLRLKWHGDRAKMLADAEGFCGRRLSSAKAMSEHEVEEFAKALAEGRNEPPYDMVPF